MENLKAWLKNYMAYRDGKMVDEWTLPRLYETAIKIYDNITGLAKKLKWD